jgi:hypothetical protein
MSRHLSRRLVALLSALALLGGGVAVAGTATGTTTAGHCCSGVK